MKDNAPFWSSPLCINLVETYFEVETDTDVRLNELKQGANDHSFQVELLQLDELVEKFKAKTLV